jgi:CLIP-associating protein 1/2
MLTTSADFARNAFSSGNPTSSILPLYSVKRVPINSDRSSQGSSNDDGVDNKVMRKYSKPEAQTDKQLMDYGAKDSHHRDNSHNYIPGFQRPLMRATPSTRSSSRSSLEEAQLPFTDPYNYVDGLTSLNDALTEGLSPNADWSARVSAFNYLKWLLLQGPKGVQDLMQSFEKVMKLFSMHLDDPHHKVAQAALSTLTELVPACRKPFESYLERILPHIFSRLVDPKEFIRQLGTSALEIMGNLYSIDSLLPALLRSLDEQRSPKAKIAVLDFASTAFAKLAVNGEAAPGNNLLKMWLAKLAPLATDKNAKLKETAVNGIISVYTHFDSSTVLNFIIGLTIEEQSRLRRALKQYTPRIEVELMNFLQNRSQKSRSKPSHDQLDISHAMDDSYVLSLGRTASSVIKSQSPSSYGTSFNNDGIRKWSGGSAGEATQYANKITAQSTVDDVSINYFRNYEPPSPVHDSLLPSRNKNNRNIRSGSPEGWSDRPSMVDRNSLDSKRGYEDAVFSHGDSHVYSNNMQVDPAALEENDTSDQGIENGQSFLKGTQQKSLKSPTVEDTTAKILTWLNQVGLLVTETFLLSLICV